jgi:hypothetical protein
MTTFIEAANQGFLPFPELKISNLLLGDSSEKQRGKNV